MCALRVLGRHTDGVKSVAWLGSTLLSAGNDQILRTWSVRDGACLQALDGHAARIWQLAVSRKAQLVASAAADGTVRLWRVADAASGGGAAAASGSGERWAAEVGAEPRVAYAGMLSGHHGDVYSVGFHPHEAHVVTAGCATRLPHRHRRALAATVAHTPCVVRRASWCGWVV
jgi:WD40 repeat protein